MRQLRCNWIDYTLPCGEIATVVYMKDDVVHFLCEEHHHTEIAMYFKDFTRFSSDEYATYQVMNS